MRTLIFAMVMVFATNVAMAGDVGLKNSVDIYRDNAVMRQLNQLLTGERIGKGAACRTQSGAMRYMIMDGNIESMQTNNDRVTFRTIGGGVFTLPKTSCDLYTNLGTMVADNSP